MLVKNAENRGIQKRIINMRTAKPIGEIQSAFLCIENHSLGEWFQRRLMSIMKK